MVIFQQHSFALHECPVPYHRQVGGKENPQQIFCEAVNSSSTSDPAIIFQRYAISPNMYGSYTSSCPRVKG